MRLTLSERLKKLESATKRLFVNLHPSDGDGFMLALLGADRIERYKIGDGYDVEKALNDTATDDWADDTDNPVLTDEIDIDNDYEDDMS